MNYADFAERIAPDYSISSDQSDVMQRLEAQAVEVGTSIYAHLRGESDIRTIGRVAFRYGQAVLPHVEELSEPLGPEQLKDKVPGQIQWMSALGHLTSAMLLPHHQNLLAGSRISPAARQINTDWTVLGFALRGTSIIRERSDLATAQFKTHEMPYKLFSKPFEAYRRLSTGYGSEVDLWLLLLEFTRKNPGTVVLQGPPQFERTTQCRAQSDYLVLHPASEQIVGLQMKSQLDYGKKYDASDKQAVLFVSGRDDLDNVKVVQTHPTSTRREIVNWPGYMALHRLALTPARSPSIRAMAPAIQIKTLQIIREARQMNEGTSPRFQTAYQRIAPRILDALGLEAAIPAGRIPAQRAPAQRAKKVRRLGTARSHIN